MFALDSLTNIYMRMRKIIFRMKIRCLVGFAIVILALSLGCIDGGNLPGIGPKEVSVDLSTPEGVMEAYWKYLDIGEYDKAYDLVCDDEYFDQLPTLSRMFHEEEFKDYARGIYGETGGKVDATTLKIKKLEKHPLTGRESKTYGVGTLVEEGYSLGCGFQVDCSVKMDYGGYVPVEGIIVKYTGRYCIAEGEGI